MDLFTLPSVITRNSANINTSCSRCVLSNVNNTSTVIDDVTGHDDVTATSPRRPPDNVISKETLRMIENVIYLGVNWVLLGVGCVGNGLSCVVFWRQGLADRMNVCLFSLALMDLGCVISWFIMGSSTILAAILPATSNEVYMTEWWKWTIRKYVRGLHRGFLFSSGCLTMLISVERCLCVWMPLRAASLVGTGTMTVFVVTSVLLVLALHLVYPFKFDVVTIFDAASNRSLVTTRGSQMFQNHRELFQVLENMVVMTLLPVLTFSVVLIATALTVLRLTRIMRWRQGVASENLAMNRGQVSLVKMLVIVSVIYIVTTCPKIILGLVRAFVPEFWRTGIYSNIFQATHQLYLALGTFNSTVNFFVYYSRSSRFRAELRWLGPVCARRHRDIPLEECTVTTETPQRV